jgi:arylsulfatase A-like enzyme
MKGNLIVFQLLLFMSIISCSDSKTKADLPNIIVFLVDDMGPMDTSVPFICDASGNPVRYPLNSFYQTPNLEKLAAQGVRFTNFYAHSVCSSSRVSLMTGQNAARHGVTTWINPEKNNRGAFGPASWNWKGLSKESVTLPLLLKQVGYKTIHVGKAHFGPFHSQGEDPLNLGFDINIGGGAIGRPGSYYGEDGFGHIKGDKIRAVKNLEKYHGTDIFLTEALTLEANAAITRAKKEGKPFFLNMSHYAVHSPFQPDPRFTDHYKNAGKSEKEIAFATLIEGIDKSLGDIVKHVKELGLGENTLLLFMGDNGSDAPVNMKDHYGSSLPLKGKKGMHWEGGMRVPFIASWVTPNDKNPSQKETPISQNEIQQQLGSILDIFPTLGQLADINIPKEHILDGYVLHDQFMGQENKKRDERFLNHFPHEHRSSYYTSLVESDWKIIYHFQIEGKARYELFNLKRDPFETHNLADKNREQLDIMMESLKREVKATGALPPEIERQPLKLVTP